MCLLRRAELKLLLAPVGPSVCSSASALGLPRSDLGQKELLVGGSSALLLGGTWSLIGLTLN